MIVERSLFVAFVFLCSCWSFFHPAGSASVWPYPHSISQGQEKAHINPTHFVVKTNSASPLLDAAIERYLKTSLFFPFGNGKAFPTHFHSLVEAELLIQSDSEELQLGFDESYEIEIQEKDQNVKMKAQTVFGGIRALETLSQLIDYDPKSETYSITTLPISIKDQPLYPWRGLLIDTSRHYLPLKTIFRTIDGMSYSKFNTLHWHIIDAQMIDRIPQSFPLCIRDFPLLCEKGGYNHGLANYTTKDIKQVVEFAKMRGVRVVIEIDSPGHAGSWGKGYPELTISCWDGALASNSVPVNPSKKLTYEVMSAIFSELSEVLIDNYIHIGGDEVVSRCWSQNHEILAWMKEKGLDSHQMFQYFIDRVQDIATENNKLTVSWEDLFQEGVMLSKDSIYEVWLNRQTMLRILNAGYKTICANGFYLDQENPGRPVYLWGDTWKIFYDNDIARDIPEKSLHNLLGGEACMWGEQVDQLNIDSRVWPRACAVAERLWSPRSVKNVELAIPRLSEHRCRLARRGFRLGPITPDYCYLPSWLSD